MRNPFRFGVRPGTDEVWIGDVGWNTWEEIKRIQTPTAAVTNLGWPCYEGSGRQSGYDSANLSICENLYAAGAGAVRAPLFAWNHGSQVVPGRRAVRPGARRPPASPSRRRTASYPTEYRGALFFADYSRDCIWAMLPGADGVPDPARIRTFAAGAANPVHLQIGPGGDLFYADFDGGTIRQVSFTSANQPPTAVATASPTTGAAPLTVQFDGSGSSDPDAGDTLSVRLGPRRRRPVRRLDRGGPELHLHQPGRLHREPARHRQPRRLEHRRGDHHRRQHAPTATITAPAPGTPWSVGDVIQFAGGATDAQDGPLRASALSWSLILHHCPSNCHTHPLQTFAGVAGGSFTAPDHEYPSYLELRLTATDSGGLTDTPSLQLDPRTVALTLNTSPSGFALALNGSPGRGALHQDRDPGVAQLDLCTVASDQGEEDMGVPLMVGRRRADARHHREQLEHLHRHLQTALSPAAAFENDGAGT